MPLKSRQQFKIPFEVFVMGCRGQKITRVRQSVGTDDAQLGEAQHRAIILADVTACVLPQQFDPKPQAARKQRELTWSDIKLPQFSRKAHRALLRHDQHLTISVVEESISHRLVSRIDVNAQPDLRRNAAVAGDGRHAVDKVRRLFGNR